MLRYPTSLVQPQTIAQLVASNYQKLLSDNSIHSQRLEALKNGQQPITSELVKLADNLELSEEYVLALRDRSFGE